MAWPTLWSPSNSIPWELTGSWLPHPLYLCQWARTGEFNLKTSSVGWEDFPGKDGGRVERVAETVPWWSSKWLRPRGLGLIFPLPELRWEEFIGPEDG